MDKGLNPLKEGFFKVAYVNNDLFMSPEHQEHMRLKRKQRKNLKRRLRNTIYTELPSDWPHIKKLIVSGKAASLSLSASFKHYEKKFNRVLKREFQKELYQRAYQMKTATDSLIDNFIEMPAILFDLFDKTKDKTGLKVEDCYYVINVLQDLLKYSGYLDKPEYKKLLQGNTPKMKGVHDLLVGEFLHSRSIERLQISQILVSVRSSLTEADIQFAYEGIEAVVDSDAELNATYQRLRNAGF